MIDKQDGVEYRTSSALSVSPLVAQHLLDLVQTAVKAVVLPIKHAESAPTHSSSVSKHRLTDTPLISVKAGKCAKALGIPRESHIKI